MNRKFITFSRIIKTGLVNFVRNAWLSISAMAIMVITLTIVLFSVITNASFGFTIQQITDKVKVSVFLLDTTDEQRGRAFASELATLPNAKGIEYLTKLQALAIHEVANPDIKGVFNAENNPLPATIHITPRDLGTIGDISAFLNQPDNKALWGEVSYSNERQEAIDKIAHSTSVLQQGGIAAVLIFTVVSILIIFNTIQMAIFNRRDELTIMRLLGASTGFIRGPFIVETIMCGLIAGLLSVLIIHGMFLVSSSALDAASLGILDINYSAVYFKQHFWELLTMQVGLGILIGAVSSYIATRRYLKFKTTK